MLEGRGNFSGHTAFVKKAGGLWISPPQAYSITPGEKVLVTGAGGGGAIIALAQSKEDGEQVAQGIKSAGFAAYEVEIDPKGLIIG